MLYKKNRLRDLKQSLFKNPTCEYRATPFWAWNCKLEKAELERQIDVFKKMGFGGFHMHSRNGLETPYMGEEFMTLVRACVDKAEKEKMLAWLYDEDRWPSGSAGYQVTKPMPKYKFRVIEITPKELSSQPKEVANCKRRTLLACYL